MSVQQSMQKTASSAREASKAIASLSEAQKNRMLLAAADALEQSTEAILSANSRDLELAGEKGLSSALQDRLLLDKSRIRGMAESLRALVQLPDPVGAELSKHRREDGLLISKVRVPLGVIAVIYESRPNVTVDAIGLAIKSGNAVILRGGSDAQNSNVVLADIARKALEAHGFPECGVSYLADCSYEEVRELLSFEEYLDLVIPRGGESLIRAVQEVSKVPLLKHYKGICHVFVDESANLEKAAKIILNAKCQRPGVCNALETLLVHQSLSAEFLPMIISLLIEQGVEVRGDKTVCASDPRVKPALESDWSEEYLALILAIRVVASLEDALKHIEKFGSRHTEAIVTEDGENAARFLRDVDASVVLHNASTRFNDGGELGLGAEMGISTDKLHARGPVGLVELTTYKYQVVGAGHVRK